MDGFIEPALAEQDGAEIVADRRIVGRKLEMLLEFGGSLVQSAQALECRPQRFVGLGQFRINGQPMLQELDTILEPAFG